LSPSNHSDDYLVVDIAAVTSGAPPTGPARVHVYRLEDGHYRVAGLERPMDHDPPELIE
jgi:hypothetical protein